MSDSPERKRREDSFFGLHFDFHAKPAAEGEIIPIGLTTTEEMVQHVIDVTEPDFIQIDCKGHPGWTSYPTKLGNDYPVIEKDILNIWRKVTARNGVALYMHYSGVCDEFQCIKHPEWKRKGIAGDGTPTWIPDGITSTFSPYAEEVVIPQFLELAGEYKVDGVWVDGECWGTQVDYSAVAMEAFRKKTGIDISGNPPVKPGDENWQEYSDFCREQFRIYLRKYIDTVHKEFPEFQIASNWAFSSKMPEKVCADVDFLSGDYLWADSLNSARYEGRCLASQGKPWDLMAWGFRWRHGDKMENCPKHPEQLKQEAATVLAMGGGFQNYYPQKKDGSVHRWQADLMSEVASFCREREEYCHKAGFIPQIALLNSTYDRYRRSRYLFQCDGEDGAIQGITQLLCETNQSFEIVSEHSIETRMSEYPLIILPETIHLEEAFLDKLFDYIEKGGSVLSIGAAPYRLLGKRLGLKGTHTSGEFHVSHDGRTWAYNNGEIVRNSKKSETGGCIVTLNGMDTEEKYPLWTVMTHGKGKIGFINSDIGETYLTRKNHVLREMTRTILDELFEPIARITGSMYIDMTLMEKNGFMMVNMVNTAGSHDDPDVFTIDEIPRVGPLEVIIKSNSKPREVLLQPGSQPLEFTYDASGKQVLTIIESIDIHRILTIR
ncbi:MAG TPA: hypothetical protein P5315_03090 [Clostridia bacterium]|nr:hypothetical protein [Clostridia bacterium]